MFALTLICLYLKLLSIFVTTALSAPFPFGAAFFASGCFSDAAASDVHAAQSHNMCSNSSPIAQHVLNRTTCASDVHAAQSHNIQLRSKKLRDKAGTIAEKVVAAEGQVANEGSMPR